MTSNQILQYSARFFLLLIWQVLVLKNMPLGQVNIYIYPIALLLLPLEISHGLLIVIGFASGLIIDMFYDTAGLHAGVMALVGLLRPITCMLYEPRGGYEMGQALTRERLGWNWFFKYTATLFAVTIFAITILEDLDFSLVWLMRFVISYIVSMIFVMLYQFIFNPK